MVRLTSLLITHLIVSGCSLLEEYKEHRDAQQYIAQATHWDWNKSGIPTEELEHAEFLCSKFSTTPDCKLVVIQLTDLRISISTCRNDHRSKLCQAVVAYASKNPSASKLKPLPPVELPQTPIYWSLPTHTLEIYAEAYKYRSETALWWWERWKHFTLPCLAVIGLIFVSLMAKKWQMPVKPQILIIDEPEASTAQAISLTQPSSLPGEEEPSSIESYIPEDEVASRPSTAQDGDCEQAPETKIDTKLSAADESRSMGTLNQEMEVKQLLKAAFSTVSTKKRRR